MNSREITREQLCKMFDHTQLKAYADEEAFLKLCNEAKEMNCAMVAINSYPVRFCKEILKDTDVHVGAAISFPLGQTTIEAKVFEAEDAIKNGADEIDYVINVGRAKQGDWDYIRREMRSMVEVCRKYNAIIKVIFENCYLTKEEIIKIASIAGEEKPDFIKTSTGFGTSGAEPEDVSLMKQYAGDGVKVKAAGGIRSWERCAQMIDTGAERIGTSSSLKILEEFDAERAKEV